VDGCASGEAMLAEGALNRDAAGNGLSLCNYTKQSVAVREVACLAGHKETT
jgi:hypothetical protein